MTRLPRRDAPGVFHHVVNRGISKRPFFEDIDDIRYFRSRIARSVCRREIEVHAYSIMTTHFHMFVRSLDGGLSDALRRIQNEYVRSFNRRHRRDGALVRGRFWSRPVESARERRILVRYIDRNPVKARLSERGVDYPHGSASDYARAKGPPWLERTWVESEVARVLGMPAYDPDAYGCVFDVDLPAHAERLMELRTQSRRRGVDPFDRLVESAPPRVRRWFERKARLADGAPVGIPVVDRETILETIEKTACTGSWRVGSGRRTTCGWALSRVALLRELSASPYAEIAAIEDRSESCVRKRYDKHRRLVAADPEYANSLAELACACLAPFRNL